MVEGAPQIGGDLANRHNVVLERLFQRLPVFKTSLPVIRAARISRSAIYLH